MRRWAWLLAALALPGIALARVNIATGEGTIWQTHKSGEPTEGFAQIRNAGDSADTLTGWSCPIADSTELVGADGKPLASLPIVPGQTVRMSPAGLHLVLRGTHFAVEPGADVPCALTFAQAGEIGLYLGSKPAPGAP